MQSGILHAAEDKDFKTAFSYFFEAFENADQAEDRPLATRAVKYMCLAKIMQNEQGAVGKLLTGKGVAKYDGPELEAMRQVGRAFDNRSLKEFLAVSTVNRAADGHLLTRPRPLRRSRSS